MSERLVSTGQKSKNIFALGFFIFLHVTGTTGITVRYNFLHHKSTATNEKDTDQ